MTLTVDQILALAPDAASAKAGSQQASPAKWSGLGSNDQAVWGLCQGSGKDPYRAQIDLSEPAFKCSCPSRKFPCKHGLGLYLVFVQHRAKFTEAEAPQWVQDWLQSRGERAEKKAAKLAEAAEPSTPEEIEAKQRSQQKRLEKRHGNIEKGLDTLDLWLNDLAREGLASVRSDSVRHWEAMAARMVDSQAPGLAYRIRNAASLIHAVAGPEREERIGRELGALALLTNSYRKLEQLPQELQADVRTGIGLTVTQEEVLALAPVQDEWIACGYRTEHEDKLSRRANYLRGANTGKWAMVLQYAAGNQMLPPPMIPGLWSSGSVHFYPGAQPLRVALGTDFKTGVTPSASATEPRHDYTKCEQVLEEFAKALALSPYLETLPMQLGQVTVQGEEGKFWLRDQDGNALPISRTFSLGWRMVAIGGGMPYRIFGLWDGTAFLPLAAQVDTRVYRFDTEKTT